jgi:hypothetical protein
LYHVEIGERLRAMPRLPGKLQRLWITAAIHKPFSWDLRRMKRLTTLNLTNLHPSISCHEVSRSSAHLRVQHGTLRDKRPCCACRGIDPGRTVKQSVHSWLGLLCWDGCWAVVATIGLPILRWAGGAVNGLPLLDGGQDVDLAAQHAKKCFER